MKVFCEYSMVDVDTGALLAFGDKWKTTDKLNADYINDGTFGIFRKRTLYHRNIEINGRRRVLLLHAYHYCRRVNYFNSVTIHGVNNGINGRLVCVDPEINADNYSSVLSDMGIVGVGVYA